MKCCRRVSACLCVCLCVSPSNYGIVSKQLNLGSRTQHVTIAEELKFSVSKDHGEIQLASSYEGPKDRWGKLKLVT